MRPFFGIGERQMQSRKNYVFATVFDLKIGCFRLKIWPKKLFSSAPLFIGTDTSHLVSLASDPMSPAGRDFIESQV